MSSGQVDSGIKPIPIAVFYIKDLCCSDLTDADCVYSSERSGESHNSKLQTVQESADLK